MCQSMEDMRNQTLKEGAAQHQQRGKENFKVYRKQCSRR